MNEIEKKKLDDDFLEEVYGGREMGATEAEVVRKKRSYYKAKLNLGHITQSEYWEIMSQMDFYELYIAMVDNNDYHEYFNLCTDWKKRYYDLKDGKLPIDSTTNIY